MNQDFYYRPNFNSEDTLFARRQVVLALILSIFLLAEPVNGQFGVPAPDEDDAGAGQVNIEVVTQYESVEIGQKFALAVVLDIPRGWYLYANPKRGEFGQDTKITPEPTAEMRFGKVIYPEGTRYEYKNLENASNYIYRGEAVCYVPVEITAEAGKLAITMKLEGQLCSDAGQCLPWDDKVTTELKVISTTEQQKANRAELFADIDLTNAFTEESPGAQESEPTGKEGFAADEWLMPILAAVVAGLAMNVMPCVLPLIPIIVLTLVKQCAPAEGEKPDRGKSIKVGLAFSAGIMIVFVGLAILMAVFKMLWGEHFQGFGFKFGLLMIVYVLSLSMFGLFEIVLPSRISNINIVKQGYIGAIGMGMLVTVLGTPCGAPVLTGVLGWSLGKPLAVMILVFLIIGAGMSVPYVILTAFPKLLARVPKGGNWMIRLKQALGFGMLGFSVYLLLSFMPGWRGPLLYFCLLVGFCVWLGLSLVNRNTPVVKRYLTRAIAVALIVAGSMVLATTDKEVSDTQGGEHWSKQMQNYQQQGKTVIVKFTSNDCKNCAVLDKIIYKTQEFKDKLVQTNAVLVIADMSYGDQPAKEMIIDLAGQGQPLPFAAVFPAGDSENPILLKDFYSMEAVLKALDTASERSEQPRE